LLCIQELLRQHRRSDYRDAFPSGESSHHSI